MSSWLSLKQAAGHVARLRDCELVEGEPRGRQVFCRIGSAEIFGVGFRTRPLSHP